MHYDNSTESVAVEREPCPVVHAPLRNISGRQFDDWPMTKSKMHKKTSISLYLQNPLRHTTDSIPSAVQTHLASPRWQSHMCRIRCHVFEQDTQTQDCFASVLKNYSARGTLPWVSRRSSPSAKTPSTVMDAVEDRRQRRSLLNIYTALHRFGPKPGYGKKTLQNASYI